jgi:PAS domain S-box-containing protein
LSEVKMLSMEAGSTAQSQLFKTTFDLTSTALFLLDDQGQILKVNSAFAELLRYSLPELLGGPFLELLHCVDRESQTVPG